MNKNKRAEKVKNAMLGVLVVLFLIAMIAGTYARYSSTGATTTNAEIADWHITLNGQDISSQERTVDVVLTPEEESNENVTAGKIAPGHTLSGELVLDPTGSEVAIDYLLTMGNVQATSGTWNTDSSLSLSRITALLEDDENATELTVSDSEIIYFENLNNVVAGKGVTFKVYVTWDNADNANNEADTANGAGIAQITVPITVVARQHIEDFFTVTFMAGDTTVSTSTVVEGQIVSRPDTDPSEEGYVFDNWYSDPEMTTVYDFASPVNGDTTIYAKMDRLCTVTFKDGETTLSTSTVGEGQTVARPVTDPTKEGYDFVNWYSDSEFTTVYDFTSAINEDTTIYAKWELAQQTWSQDGINVTDGIITLKVGSAVTGYTGGGLGDGNWYVLGAKDGKLLITTTANVGSTIQLSGQTGYANGISILNTAASSYLNPNLADESRSINVDDINRVTKYDPVSTAYGSGNVYAYGNQVKYTLNSIDGKIHSQGETESYLPASDTSSSHESFTYWTGSVWKSLLSGENTTLTSNTYCYYPANLTAKYNTECFIKDQNDSEPAFELLFHNGSGSKETYWLGSTYIEARVGKLYLRITKRQYCSSFWFRRISDRRDFACARMWLKASSLPKIFGKNQ